MIRVVSWNILAQQYLKIDEFKHLDEFHKGLLSQWEVRRGFIISTLTKMKADIILLQEVTLASFEEDFKNMFNTYNYVIHINNKHRRNPIGNAILFRKDKFTLVESHSRTKAIHAKLAFDKIKSSTFTSNE